MSLLLCSDWLPVYEYIVIQQSDWLKSMKVKKGRLNSSCGASTTYLHAADQKMVTYPGDLNKRSRAATLLGLPSIEVLWEPH